MASEETAAQPDAAVLAAARSIFEAEMSDPVMQVLGRIEGKLDSEISLAKEHREDDKRRFGEVYTKLGEHDQEIAKAQGAKGVILWLIGGGAAALGALVVTVVKTFGG